MSGSKLTSGYKIILALLFFFSSCADTDDPKAKTIQVAKKVDVVVIKDTLQKKCCVSGIPARFAVKPK